MSLVTADQARAGRAGAGRPGAGRTGPPPRADLIWVGVVTLLAAALYAAIALQAYHRYLLGSYDAVIFDQAMRGYAGLSAPVSAAKGVHNGFGPDFSILGDHFSPVLAALAPLYWVYDHPIVLLLAQAVLFAAAVPIVWIAANRQFGRLVAYGVAVAFGLGFPLQVASLVGLHEVAFAVPLTALALERLQAGRHGQACLAALGLLLVKEDMGLVVAVFGVVVAARGRWRAGLATAAAGVLGTLLAIVVLIPAFGGRSDYYWYYDQLGPGPASAAWHVLSHPVDTVQLALTPEIKWQTLLWLFGTLGLVCLGSSLVWPAAPLLAERLLSANPNHWGIDHHYDAYLWPILLFAALEGMGKLVRQLDRRGWGRPLLGRYRLPPVWAAGCVLGIVVLSAVRFPAGDVFAPGAWRTTERVRAAAAAVAVIPDGATVEVTDRLGPHLTSRATVLLLDQTPRGADWLIFDLAEQQFPFADLGEQLDRLARARLDRYEVVFEQTGYLILHRSRT